MKLLNPATVVVLLTKSGAGFLFKRLWQVNKSSSLLLPHPRCHLSDRRSGLHVAALWLANNAGMDPLQQGPVRSVHRLISSELVTASVLQARGATQILHRIKPLTRHRLM